jgi:hypothetical protein
MRVRGALVRNFMFYDFYCNELFLQLGYLVGAHVFVVVIVISFIGLYNDMVRAQMMPYID